MIDFPWPLDVGKTLDLEFQTKPHFVDQTVALRQRNGFEELMTKYLRKYSWIKPIDYHDR